MKTIVPVVFATLLLAGCVAYKIDRPARLGSYTYDHAAIEFGPPDKTAKLPDGSIVAEWLTQRGQLVIAPEPYFMPPGCYFGPLMPTYS